MSWTPEDKSNLIGNVATKPEPAPASTLKPMVTMAKADNYAPCSVAMTPEHPWPPWPQDDEASDSLGV